MYLFTFLLRDQAHIYPRWAQSNSLTAGWQSILFWGGGEDRLFDGDVLFLIMGKRNNKENPTQTG